MNLQIASDLHLEHLIAAFPGYRVIEPAPGADVLILAGDIHSGIKAVKTFADWPVPVLYVVGNHEFYGHSFDQLRVDLSAACRGTNVHFLDNSELVLGDIRFLGATLWTDYRLFSGMPVEKAHLVATANLADHRYIGTQAGMFSPKDACDQHEQSLAWLKRRLAQPFDGKTVVISHHAPHIRSVHERYLGSPLNVCFASNLDAVLEGPNAPALWVHGHVHDTFAYKVGACQVVANPRGYARNKWGVATVKDIVWENPGFDDKLVVRVGESL